MDEVNRKASISASKFKNAVEVLTLVCPPKPPLQLLGGPSGECLTAHPCLDARALQIPEVPTYLRNVLR